MKVVPIVNYKGEIMEKHTSYSSIIQNFLNNPCDISNNCDLIQMKQSLELTINTLIVP